MPPVRPRVRAFVRHYATQSQAAYVDTDDGEYVIKAVNNRDGPPVLIAEWVGSMAARWLGVSTPDFAVVELTAAVDVPLDDDELEMAQPGPCFGSKVIEAAAGWNGDAAALDAVENQAMIPAVVVLDTWLINLDRFCRNPDGRRRFNNPGNLLLVPAGAGRGRFRMVAIDFGYALGGPSWSARRLGHLKAIQDGDNYGLFPAFRTFMRREWLQPVTSRLRELTPQIAGGFLEGVPPEWKLSPSAAAAVADFLHRRAGYVAARLDDQVYDDDNLWSHGGRDGTGG